MKQSPIPFSDFLDNVGLNLQHVFNLLDLPADLLTPLAVQPHEKQLILFGHGGRRMWECVQANGMQQEHPDHPIDSYSRHSVLQWFAQAAPENRVRLAYPEFGTAPEASPPGKPVNLQALGQFAGWHHTSPLRLGINADWGTWFAYRAVALADSDFAPSVAVKSSHPCESCMDKPCISACPAHALDTGLMEFRQCGNWRLQENSPCALHCSAREACPVGREHRYDPSQTRHSFAQSLRALKHYL